MITKKYLKGLLTYYAILRYLKTPYIAEENLVKLLSSVKTNDYSYENISKIKNGKIQDYINRKDKTYYMKTINKIKENNGHYKENNGIIYKLSKSIFIIEYPSKDKLYFKITERETIRFLAGIIKGKKVKGNLIVKDTKELDIFLFNYELNAKYTTKQFKEVLDILNFN
jgi:tetrahydromethanopterin S-methyltransferase subunit A